MLALIPVLALGAGATALAGRPTALDAGATALAAGAQAHAAELGPAPPSAPVELVLPLKADLSGLEHDALAVSTPGSAQYGQYESIGVLARRFGASPRTRGRVLAYLRAAGARNPSVDATGLFADVTISAARAQRLFGTPLSQFATAAGARFLAPTAAVRVPAGLQGLVTGVVGLDTRPLLSAPATLRPARAPAALHEGERRLALARAGGQASSEVARTGTPTGCAAGVASGGFTPNQYLTAYGYGPLRKAAIAGQGERVALIEIDGFKYSDIKAFARCFGLRIPKLEGFGVGVHRLLAPGGEATLDLEVLDAAAPGLKSIGVYETRPTAADTLRALTAPLRSGPKPQVISASLGLCEPSLHSSVGRAGIRAAEGALQMAAASGITFLASSGDQGSADCTARNGSPIRLPAVNYPASSWWVTGVGGTNLVLDAANQIVTQLVWNDAGDQPGSAGGGGFSDLFRRPRYQTGSVSSKNRAVPDVSMLADIVPGYAIYCSAAGACVNPFNHQPWQTVGGTSAATPLLAGGLALVDQELRSHGRQALGLANPLLYGTARSSAATAVFDDVTAIGNDVGPYIGGNGQPLGCCQARSGYDEASGLGSVNVASLLGSVLAVQPRIVGVRLSLPAHQRPVADHGILATVSCTGPCLMGAYADLAIGHASRFAVQSRLFRLRSSAGKTIKLRFSSRQLARLRAALAAHERVRATVHGVIVDPTVFGVLPVRGRAIQKRTRGGRLRVSS